MEIVYSIGFLASLYIFLRLGHQFLVMVKMVLFPKPFKMEKYGEWAVITGCTDGIGTFMSNIIICQLTWLWHWYKTK